MNTLKQVLVRSICAGTLALAASSSALSQTYPEKPVRILVPFAAGGTVDIVARLLGERFRQTLGQTFIVENRVGASGNIGTAAAAKSPGDGYTLILGAANTHAINPSLFKNAGYHALDDFTPISLIALAPNVMAINPSVPANTVAEFIAYAKANPGKLNYGSIGSGSTLHMIAEMFKKVHGLFIVHIPYGGQGTLVQALASKDVHVVFNNISNVQALIKSNQLRGLAVTLPQRWPELPSVPTFAEAGVKGFEFSSWVALFGPAKMPPQVVEILSRETVNALKVPEIRTRIASLGTVIVGSSAAELAKFQADEVARWANVVKVSGATVD